MFARIAAADFVLDLSARSTTGGVIIISAGIPRAQRSSIARWNHTFIRFLPMRSNLFHQSCDDRTAWSPLESRGARLITKATQMTGREFRRILAKGRNQFTAAPRQPVGFPLRVARALNGVRQTLPAVCGNFSRIA